MDQGSAVRADGVRGPAVVEQRLAVLENVHVREPAGPSFQYTGLMSGLGLDECAGTGKQVENRIDNVEQPFVGRVPGDELGVVGVGFRAVLDVAGQVATQQNTVGQSAGFTDRFVDPRARGGGQLGCPSIAWSGYSRIGVSKL
ncbi:hypothetical protein [Streptomyces sp. NPDC048385]